MKASQVNKASQLVLAFVPWGDVFEDSYGSIGVSFDKFCNGVTGSLLVKPTPRTIHR